MLYENIQEATMINKIPGQWVLFRTKSSFLFESVESNIIAIEFIHTRAVHISCLLIQSSAFPPTANHIIVYTHTLTQQHTTSRVAEEAFFEWSID